MTQRPKVSTSSLRANLDNLKQATSQEEQERLISEVAAAAESANLLLDEARTALTTLPETALAAALLASRIALFRSEPLTEARAMRFVGQAQRALGRHAEALESLRSAREAAEKASDPLLAAQTQIGAIDSLVMLARYDEAISLGEQLEAALRNQGAEVDAAKVLVNVGGAYFRRDRYAEALECYVRAGEVLSHSPDPTHAANAWVNAANSLTQQGRVEQAIALYERARAVFIEHGYDSGAAVVDLNVGYLHHISGRPAHALASLTEAYNSFVRRGRLHEAARCAVDRGDVYRTFNLYEEARRDYESALSGFRDQPADYDMARAEMGLAGVLFAMQQTREAIQALGRAEAVFVRQKNPVLRAFVRLQHAEMIDSHNTDPDAAVKAESAERVFARRKLAGWAAEARFIRCSQSLRTYIGANTGARRSMWSVVRAARKHHRGWLECRALRALGSHSAVCGRTAEALRIYRAAVDALEQTRTLIAPEHLHVAYFQDKQAVYEEIVGLLLERGRLADRSRALEYAERSRSRLLLERIQTVIEGRATGGDRALASDRVAELRAELSRAYYRETRLDDRSILGDQEDERRSVTTVEPGGPSLVEIERNYEAAVRDAEVAATRPGQFGTFRSAAPLNIKIPAIDQICNSVGPDETILVYYKARDRYWVFLVSQDRVDVRPLGLDIRDLTYAHRRLRYHLNRMSEAREFRLRHEPQLQAEILSPLRDLHDLLLRPIEDELHMEKLVVIPHGTLHAIPFHALFDGQRHAVERWEIVTAPSVAVWLYGKRKPQVLDRAYYGSGGVGFKGPWVLFGVDVPGLCSIPVEIETLRELQPDACIAWGQDATLEAFHRLAGGARLLHVASHARFRADNPLYSGIRFADGWLLARDLYEMHLECNLATLSACDTGVMSVAPGDELFGLTRGFLAAGARSVAASLWPVEDSATASLMGEFYRRLCSGASNAAALRAAQLGLMKTRPHPYYWAAFSLIGER